MNNESHKTESDLNSSREETDTHRPMPATALFTIAKDGHNPNAPQPMNGSTKCGIQTHGGILFSLEKEVEGNSDSCHDKDEP